MAVRDELNDPWSWLLAGLSGGLTWAVLAGSPGLVGLIAGIAVGAAVLLTKVAIGAGMNRQQLPPSPKRDSLPAPPPHTPAAGYLNRAAAARGRMADLARRPGDPWLRAEVAGMDDGADEVLSSMRDLAGRATLADQLLSAGNGPALLADRAAISDQLAKTTDPLLVQERTRALAAVDEQLAGLNRLAGLRDQLLVRLHTAAVGLETLATRMGEVVTLGSASFEHDRASQLLSDAGDDLEALRAGLAEAQQLARGVGPV